MSPHLPSSLLQLLRPTSPECCDKSSSDRHFVTWTDQEDATLRQAINTYGTEKWSVIAAQFHNKTGRQCRRRWHTYLSTDCKKGGWSPEEDQLLLEAHGKYGNRWTEIAKMVPGRTDNAVKNRFCALGKKEAKKIDALSSESCKEMGGKTVNKRRILEQNSSIANKRFKGDYNLSQHQTAGNHDKSQMKKSAQNWKVDESLAYRAHPVQAHKPLNTAYHPTDASHETKESKSSNFSYTSPPVNSTLRQGAFQVLAGSFSDNISPPRLAALTQNAALLDSLVERRDARMKQWGGAGNTWKSFGWSTLEERANALHAISIVSQLADKKKDSFGEDKENHLDLGQMDFGSGFTPALFMGHQESAAHHKQHHDLGALTPTVQHERSWKVRPELEVPDCSSPSNAGSVQAGDSSPVQTDCLSSTIHVDTCCHPCLLGHLDKDCLTAEGVRSEDVKEPESPVLSSSLTDVSSPMKIVSDDLQFLLDDMPNPEFSDSEKQFLLSALDSTYQHSLLGSPLLDNSTLAYYCVP